MKVPGLWSSNQDLISDPFKSLRREMEDMFRAFDRNLPSPSIGAGAPAIDVAETNDAFEVTAELPGVEEKDIKVSVDGNRLVISGEKKQETKKDEKDWHVEERGFGSFYRSMSLPFKPDEGAVEAYFDKGVLHLNIKKPSEIAKSAKTIEIKPGAPPNAAE
jgi:HSP20 family protein